MLETRREMRSGVRRRLAFIDFRLFWDGRFNRRNLVDAFGISTQQASADIAQYTELAPANLAYDSTHKAYLRTERFAPAFTYGSAERYLLHLIAIENRWVRQEDTWFETRPPIESAPLVRRPTDPRILLDILDAIHRAEEIAVDLVGGGADIIAPIALFFAAERWFVRVWAAEHDGFRDYGMSQIARTGAAVPSRVDPALDFEWHEEVELEIAPNPALPAQQQAMIAAEYGMEDGRLVATKRISQVPFLMAEHAFDIAPGILPPLRQQLVLLNRDAVEAACASARTRSADALAAQH